MNKYLLAFLVVLAMSSFTIPEENPFFQKFDTPFGVPPFDRIKVTDYAPAFLEGMKQQRIEMETITSNPQPPSFANTIEALEKSGQVLTRVSDVFYNLTSADTNDDLQRIARDMAPLLARHNDDILLNEKLFARIKTVYEGRKEIGLNAEQQKVLEEYYLDFVRGGANLKQAQKEELRKINEELSVLSLQFGDNVLKEDNAYELVIETAGDLAGLPESVVNEAAQAAREKGKEGRWLFTLHKPSFIPFLQYSQKRELRRQIFEAYINRGNHNDANDNKTIASRMVVLRTKKARLLGYPTHANFILERNMASEPERVYDLLNQVWAPARRRAMEEARELQGLIEKEGGVFKLEPWDWWYYAEKLRKEKYNLEDDELRPYFNLEAVRDGAFYVANRLYGLKFEERPDVPVYHPDAKAYEVKEADGRHVGIFYVDYFPRSSKRGGAWMNEFRREQKVNGRRIAPIIVNVCNFTRPTGDRPALLSFSEVTTLFHEFGHALHGLLSDVTYPRLSGTSVPRDFVELPSQIMENWAAEPEVLKHYARHYKTGEAIPDSLIEKIVRAGKFNQGFETVEFLAAAFLDMDWHTLETLRVQPSNDFEARSMRAIGLPPEIVVRYRTTNFSHIFAGGYSAGYYSYLWAEVLDADAFQVFKEKGLFDPVTAKSFRDNILSMGGTADPMQMYERFRGAEPGINPLLERRGLLDKYQ